MKNIILICSLLITSYSYGQIVNKKVQRIAKKNVEIFLSPKFDKNEFYALVIALWWIPLGSLWSTAAIWIRYSNKIKKFLGFNKLY